MSDPFLPRSIGAQDQRRPAASASDAHSEYSGTSSSSTVKTYRRSIEGGVAHKHGYTYDIYIAYEDSDHPFAMEHVIKKLDADFGGNYKCVIESRDFLPGAFTTEAMLDAMHESYRIFLLLSANFYRGTICDWVVAHAQSQCQLKKHLVPIKIDDCEVPRVLRAMVILDFTQMEREEFYRRIKSILLVEDSILPGRRCRESETRIPSPSPAWDQSQSQDSPPVQHGYRPILRRWSPHSEDKHVQQSRARRPRPHTFASFDCWSGSSWAHVDSDPDTRQADNKEEDDVSFPGLPLQPGEDLVSGQISISGKSDYTSSTGSKEWRKKQFHKNPKEFIKTFCETNPGSSLFVEIVSVMHDIMTNDASSNGQYMNNPILAQLTCCCSDIIKRKAFSMLEWNLTSNDGDSQEQVGTLKETEDILRNSICGEEKGDIPKNVVCGRHFRNEVIQFQICRIRTYGQVLFCVALQVEKKCITVFGELLKKMEDVVKVIKKLLAMERTLTNEMKYSLLFSLEAYRYLSKVVLDIENNVTTDNISDIIKQHELTHSFTHYAPWPALRRQLLVDNAKWIHMDVIANILGHMVFVNPDMRHILLRNVTVLCETIDTAEWDKTAKLQPKYFCGTLLSIARLLANLAVSHPSKDVRIQVVFGTHFSKPKGSGLQQIWKCSAYRNEPEFHDNLEEVIYPLLLTSSKDDQIQGLIADTFCVDTYSLPEEEKDKPLCEERVGPVVEKHLVREVEGSGQLFVIKQQILQNTRHVIIKEGRLGSVRCAVKMLKILYTSQLRERSSAAEKDWHAKRRLINEIKMLSVVKHRNVVQCLCMSGVKIHPVHLITEYMDAGDLSKLLLNSRKIRPLMSIEHLLSLCVDVGNALEYLAKRKIIHRDICAANILVKTGRSPIGAPYICKLSGFGLAVQLDREAREITLKHDPLLVRWSAHESVTSSLFSVHSDCWMFGCFLEEVFTYGCPPFPECCQARDVHKALALGNSLEQPKCVPDDLYLLVLKCLHLQPSSRISVPECVKYLKSIAAGKGDESLEALNLPVPPQPLMERLTDDDFENCALPFLLQTPAQLVPPARTKKLYTPLTKILGVMDKMDMDITDMPVLANKHMNVPHTSGVTPVEFVVMEKIQLQFVDKLWHRLKELNHKNVVQVFSLDPLPDATYNLISECTFGGSIVEHILAHQGKPNMDSTFVIGCMVQVADGLNYLHNIGHLLHTDLKGENIVIQQEIYQQGHNLAHVKISRLGRCQPLIRSSDETQGKSPVTTPVPRDALRWAAPEVLHSPAFYSRQSDVYSYGKLFWQLLYALQVPEQPDARRVVPHANWPQDREVFRQNLLLRQQLEQPQHCPPWLYFLLKKCFRMRIKRPSVELIRNCLTARAPYDSQLLRNFKMMSSDEYDLCYGNIDLDVVQPQTAWYVCESPLMEDDHSQPCLDPELEEEDSFYQKGMCFQPVPRPKCSETDETYYNSFAIHCSNDYTVRSSRESHQLAGPEEATLVPAGKDEYSFGEKPLLLPPRNPRSGVESLTEEPPLIPPRQLTQAPKYKGSLDLNSQVSYQPPLEPFTLPKRNYLGKPQGLPPVPPKQYGDESYDYDEYITRPRRPPPVPPKHYGNEHSVDQLAWPEEATLVPAGKDEYSFGEKPPLLPPRNPRSGVESLTEEPPSIPPRQLTQAPKYKGSLDLNSQVSYQPPLEPFTLPKRNYLGKPQGLPPVPPKQYGDESYDYDEYITRPRRPPVPPKRYGNEHSVYDEYLNPVLIQGEPATFPSKYLEETSLSTSVYDFESDDDYQEPGELDSDVDLYDAPDDVSSLFEGKIGLNIGSPKYPRNQSVDNPSYFDSMIYDDTSLPEQQSDKTAYSAEEKPLVTRLKSWKPHNLKIPKPKLSLKRKSKDKTENNIPKPMQYSSQVFRTHYAAVSRTASSGSAAAQEKQQVEQLATNTESQKQESVVSEGKKPCLCGDFDTSVVHNSNQPETDQQHSIDADEPRANGGDRSNAVQVTCRDKKASAADILQESSGPDQVIHKGRPERDCINANTQINVENNPSVQNYVSSCGTASGNQKSETDEVNRMLPLAISQVSDGDETRLKGVEKEEQGTKSSSECATKGVYTLQLEHNDYYMLVRQELPAKIQEKKDTQMQQQQSLTVDMVIEERQGPLTQTELPQSQARTSEKSHAMPVPSIDVQEQSPQELPLQQSQVMPVSSIDLHQESLQALPLQESQVMPVSSIDLHLESQQALPLQENQVMPVSLTDLHEESQQKLPAQESHVKSMSTIDLCEQSSYESLLDKRHMTKYRIKKEGGIITLPGGIKLIVPACAFSQGEHKDLLVGITENEADLPILAAGQVLASPTVFVSPHGAVFERPVILSIPHSKQVSSADQVSQALYLLHSQTEIGTPTRWCKWDNSNTGEPQMFSFMTAKSCILVLTHFCLFTMVRETGDFIEARSLRLMVFVKPLQIKDQHLVNLRVIALDDDDSEVFEKRFEKLQYGELVCNEPLVVYNTRKDVKLRLLLLEPPWMLREGECTEKVFKFLQLWRNLGESHLFLLQCDHQTETRGPIICKLTAHQDCGEPDLQTDTTLAFSTLLPEISGTYSPVSVTNSELQQPPSTSPQLACTLSDSINHLDVQDVDTANCALSADPQANGSYHDEVTLPKQLDEGNQSVECPPLAEVASRVGVIASQQPAMRTHLFGHMFEMMYYRQLYDLYCMMNHKPPTSCVLPFELTTKLSHLLDAEDPLNRDWRLLASKMSLSDQIPRLKGSRSPTELLLSIWQTENKSVSILKDMLKDMERTDAVGIIESFYNSNDTTAGVQGPSQLAVTAQSIELPV